MEAYHTCLQCMNQRVRLLTTDGRTFEGVITNVDRRNVYLKPDPSGRVRTSQFGFFWGFNDDIVTLSLFTLLALFLI